MAVSSLYQFVKGLLPGGRRRADFAPSQQLSASWAVSVMLPAGPTSRQSANAPYPSTQPQSLPSSRPAAGNGLAPLTTPPPRAVPFPINALSALLDAEPTSRARLGHLALLESAWLASRDNPFSLLPLRTLDVALKQLESAARMSPGLDLLRIQLDRHRQERRSRIEAVLAGGDAAADQRLALREGVIAGSPWTDTEFLDTMPLERAA